MYKAEITITLRPSILDPQGKAVQHALAELGHSAIMQVRAGKHMELLIDVDSREAASSIATKACEQLLANAVMEDFAVDVTELEPAETA